MRRRKAEENAATNGIILPVVIKRVCQHLSKWLNTRNLSGLTDTKQAIFIWRLIKAYKEF